MPTTAALTVVGAGIHGIHILLRVVESGLFPPERCAIVDPHERAFAQWQRRAVNCHMGFLRSPASHGIDPDFRSLRRQAPGDSPFFFTPPYHRPSVELFARHITERSRDVLSGLAWHVGTVRAVERRGEDYELQVNSPAGVSRLDTSVVILAPGQPPPAIPPIFAGHMRAGLVEHIHSSTFHPDSIPSGARVALVGGGIAAAHLAAWLYPRGITVHLWNRDRPTSWQFDSDPCFIGPRCGDFFGSLRTAGLRRRVITRSRRPGSLPPDLYDSLRRAIRFGNVDLRREEVRAVWAAGERHVIQGSKGSVAEYDRIVLATGFSPGPPMAEVISPLAAHAPVADDGYPIPAGDLSWLPKLYLTGALAELEIGPPARNIAGAHLAGRRIVPALKALKSRSSPRRHR